MKRISVVALLYAIAGLPAYAADDGAYVFSAPDADRLLPPAVRSWKAELARLGTISLWQVNDGLALYGKLSVRHLHAGDAEAGIHYNSPTYGLRGQFDSPQGIGIRFGWDRYVAGANSGDDLYSLSATVKF